MSWLPAAVFLSETGFLIQCNTFARRVTDNPEFYNRLGIQIGPRKNAQTCLKRPFCTAGHEVPVPNCIIDP